MDQTSAAQYYQPSTSDSTLAQLSKLAEEQAGVQAKVAYLEAQLAAARDELKDLAERQVPELMDEVGISEFKTSSGLKIKIAETIRASISKVNAARAFAWLKEHGHAALIKSEVSVAFGKGCESDAEALAKQLSQNFEVEMNTSVHPQTLAAWVRERLGEGEEVPLDLFGVHRQRVSKIDA